MSGKIILASSSPRRQQLLREIGLPFQVRVANVEEALTAKLSPAEQVKMLAERKACAVAEQISGGLVIGADTVVWDGDILGKPKDENEARLMLKRLSGKEHLVYTGVSVVDVGTGSAVTDYERTRVRFRSLSEEEIIRYVATGEPLDKAGAYGIQGVGALLVEGIEGCYFNVVGLPIVKLRSLLQNFGFDMLAAVRPAARN
ncbi:MAG: septum formation inhibitor Maf [Peptococcaceae bacterium]|nr:septum formation inhibitor Maf [Peptococcaceae bacterium]